VNGPNELTAPQLALVATGYGADHWYKPGDSGCSGIVNGLLAMPLLVTTTLTGPSAASSGAWTVIWLGSIADGYRGRAAVDRHAHSIRLRGELAVDDLKARSSGAKIP
jgi:hypothetical protein